MKRNYCKLKNIAAVFVIAAISFASCSKEESTLPQPEVEGEVVGEGEAALIFSAVNLNEEGAVAKASTGAMAKASEVLMEETEWQVFDELEAQAGFSTSPVVKTDIQRAGTAGSQGLSASAQGMKAATLMPNGIKFYIVIRDKDGNIAYHGEHTSGTKKTVRVDPYVKYEWFAYSINENTVPAFDASSGIVNKAGLSNKDILYSSGEIDAVPGDNVLGVSFRRNTVRYNLEINTRGLFAQVKNSTRLTLMQKNSNNYQGIVKTGDLNVFTGEYENIEAVDQNALHHIQDDATHGAAVRKGTIYSVSTETVPANSMTVTLTKLDVTLNDSQSDPQYKNRSFTNPTYIHTNAHPDFTPKRGHEYALNVRVMESPLWVTGRLTQNGQHGPAVPWARTNLKYEPNHPDKYIFTASHESKHDINEAFWNYKALTPKGVENQGDPCDLVYPAGKWRMPTATEGEQLGKTKVKGKYEQYGLLFGATMAAGYELADGETPNPAYPELSRTQLYFSMFGYRNVAGTSIQASPTGILWGTLGSGEGQYWIQTMTNGNNYLYWKYTRVGLGPIGLFTISDYAEVKKGNVKEGRMVRCVRS